MHYSNTAHKLRSSLICPVHPLESANPLISPNIHPLSTQLLSRQLYLSHYLLMRLGNIIEGEDAPAKLEE
jgi:hypothetical protein